ncbi:hypothetical protein QQ054_36405 [Oscillatoria amoena NRMC-F 0135]|nr:hypothetical protein [Oscillatoria amoena NRMC-F 0135]
MPKGYLKAAFDAKTSVSRSALNDLVLEELRHNLSMGEGAQSAGLMPTGYESKAAFTEQQKQKREKDFANLLHQLHMARLQLMQELIDLQEAIEELTRKIEEKGRCIESIEEYLKDFSQSGKFSVGEDGYPEDFRLKTLIREWEKDNHKKWDCSDENEALEILNGIKSQQEAYKDEFEVERVEKQKEWTVKNKQLEGIDETITQIEQQGGDTITRDKTIALIESVSSNKQQSVGAISPVKLEDLKM